MNLCASPLVRKNLMNLCASPSVLRPLNIQAASKAVTSIKAAVELLTPHHYGRPVKACPITST
jgi:hypothetical protein